MTVQLRLLSTYKGNKPGTIVTVDDATGAQLLRGGVNATTDLTGGVTPDVPAVANARIPALVEVNAAGVAVGLTTQGGLQVAAGGKLVMSGNPIVGGTVSANYSDGGTGTFQFTRKTGTGNPVAFGSVLAVGSIYTIQQSDVGSSIGAQPVTYIPPAATPLTIGTATAPVTTAPLAPTITNVVAGTNSVTATFTRNADNGGDTVTGDRLYVYKASDNTLLGQANGTSPLTLTGLAAGVAVVCKASSFGAINGEGPLSAASASVTPTAPAQTGTLLQVASGTFDFNAKAGATAFGSKTIHTAAESLTGLKVVHANWYVVGGNPEQGLGSTATIKCTIEYPIGGTKTQFLYSGSLTGSIPDLTELESDMLTLPTTIPAGAEFAIYSSWTNSGGVPYFAFYAADGRQQGMSNPTPDLTVPGSTGNWTALATTGATYAGPVALVGMSTNKAVLIPGDSISVGRGDTAAKYQGFLARAFGPVAATGHIGISGDRLSSFVLSHARRVGLARYFTHVAINIGINDTTAGGDATTIQTNMATMVKYFTDLGKKVAICTLGPVSTDTANTWAALGTQTTNASNSVRATINTARKAGMTGVSVVYDINPALENVLSPEDGLWKASGGAGQTADGTHPNALGYANAAALINPTLLLTA